MNFTKTQKKILEILADGGRHHAEELKKILPDQNGSGLARHKTVIVHVCYLRRKLRPIGQDILCEFYQRKKYYRHVRLIGKS